MPLTDPIADLLTRMANAQRARRTECHAPWSRLKEQICQLLQREGFLAAVRVESEGALRELIVTFPPGRAALSVRRVSKPGSRRYVPANGVRPLLKGFSLAILSTSSGLLTDRQAKARGVGGELLCLIS